MPLTGWVHFIAKEIDPDKLDNNRTYKVTIIDSVGREFQITKVSGNPLRGKVSVCIDRKSSSLN